MEYLSIGKISKLSNLSIRTLRYYDEVNLFKPEYINEKNNYRYYSVQQLFYLETIKQLRKLNIPINDIREAISLSPEKLSLFLKKQENEIQIKLDELGLIKKLLKNQRADLYYQKELLEKPEEIVYKRRIGKRTIVKWTCNRKITPLTQPDIYFSDLYSLLEKNDLFPKSYQYNCAYPLKDYHSIDKLKYKYLFINTYLPKNSPSFSMTNEIAEGEYLCIKFNWNVESYLSNYLSLKQTYEDLGYRGEPMVYEVSRANHLNSTLDESFVTELQIKI